MSRDFFVVPSQEGGGGGGNVHQLFPVKRLDIRACETSGKELTEILSHFPSLSRLDMERCGNVTGLGVASSSEGRQTGGIGENDDGGLLLLPPKIQELSFDACGEMTIRSLQGLRHLERLHTYACGKFLPSDPSPDSCYFPHSLQRLYLQAVEGTQTLPPIPDLTLLSVHGCAHLTCDGAWPRLTALYVTGSPKFFTGPQDIRGSSKLETLRTDDVAGALTEPICRHLASFLAELKLLYYAVEHFTEAQEEALAMLVSLREFSVISMPKLRCLPSGRSLAGLEKLCVMRCGALQSLPKDGLPGTLRELDVQDGKSEELTRLCRRFKGIIPIVRI